MKKVFLFLTMLLFAFTGVTRANVQQNRAGQVIEQGFEDGLGDWTLNHCHASSGVTSGYSTHSGSNVFRFYYTTNYPQYLISPEFDEENGGGNITFYVARYSGNYPETYQVGYSFTTNDPSAFTWYDEATCTTIYSTGYDEVSYDLPAGVKYVSIACTSNDQFYMFVDDITVTLEEAPAPTPGGLVEVTIGDPTSTTTNQYLPGYTLYDYAISQQIYTADEIGVAGTINTLTMWLKNSSSYARNINVYMKEVEATEFASNTAWESFAAADMVASFTMPNDNSFPIEVAFDLNTPFEYSGNSSLAICFQDVTGSWSSGLGGVEMDATGNQALYAYRDGTVYDPSNPGVNGTLLAKKNVIRLSIMTGGDEPTAFSTIPEVLDLGYRPNGAWMAPYTFAIKSNIGATTINALDFSGNYFTYNAELPAVVSANNPLNVELTTGTAAEGLVASTMTIMYSGNRDVEQHPVTAYAYDPAEGDVWENAIEVSMAPRTEYTEVIPSGDGIQKNYDLRYETTDEDVVYKVTFDENVLFYAGAEQGVVELYTEDFKGQDGPMADNYYEYNGPTINPGPMAMWFSYDYTGSNTFFGTSAGGGMIFGYRITPAMLQELGLGNCAITTVEAAAREGSYYDLMILKGGDTPDLNNIVYYQAFDNYEPFYFFDVNLDEPQFLGDDENLWIMFYSDSPYAAYSGRQPVDAANSKIWYTTDLTNWYSNTTYTPVIYTRFLELPTGREVTVNLADMTIRESKGATGELAAVEGNVMNVAKAQMHRGNRDTETLTVHDGSATNGYVPVYGFYGDAYNKCEMVYPATELSVMDGGTINSLTFYATSPAAEPWTGTFQVFMKEVTATTISDFDGPGTVVYEGTLNGTQSSMTITFATPYEYNGGNLLVGVYQTATGNYKSATWAGESVTGASGSGYNYSSLDDISFTQRNFLPKTTFSYEAGGTPEPPTPPTPEPFVPSFEAQIDGMYVPAGTYYVVATGDELHMAYDAVPAPEQAYILAPYDGETNVAAPYLAEWILGDYTTEMQVLVGTQYPPQTALIDWTDYLVESAFLVDLEPNQSYFMQVNERNAAGTTEGEIIAFTTPIEGVTGFAVENEELYPGDAAVFTWDANRSFKGYNLYMSDGYGIVKVNEGLITENTYSVEGLEYNMNGYYFAVTAVYDAGESDYSDAVVVYMTGNGTVSGHAYDKPDEDTDAQPIAFALVEFSGIDQYGEEQSFILTADEEGAFEGEILAGEYEAAVVTEGYDNTIVVEGIEVNYNELTENIDIYTHEYYYPLTQITATEQEEENNVLVEWSWTPAEVVVDFETGDFSQANFVLPTSYPWAITTGHAHEGTYSMKSTCEGQASASSTIELTVDVPFDAKMGFWVSVSSEANYDKFHFYIDGVEKGAAISGTQAYAYKEFDVTEGTHTYKWEYAKDSSVNSGDDCAYVDDITLYRYEAPLPPVVGATTYDFDDDTMMGWTSIDADGDGNGWVSSANPGIYHNSGVNLSGTGNNASEAYVISGSYANQTSAALTPDNYLVSPAQLSAENGAQIQFWACAQDESYAAEHFGVAVSTTTATASAFTTIQEWTMTAKGVRGAEQYSEVRGTRQGSWYQFAVDLSAYAGQDIWVAIRHFNCTDMFILNVDDITLATGATKAPRGNRSFASYNLYRRNNLVNETPVLIAEGLAEDVLSYTDEAWAELPYGVYQWGIQATYAGYAPVERSVMSSVDRNAEDNKDFAEGEVVVNGNRAQWDLVNSFEGTSGYQYGVATDGNNIYTSSWSASSSSMFYKYDMEGNFIEEFNISGSGQCRGLTYDGQYFYGVANSSTVYCLDLANHALVNSFTTSYGAMRCITYDPQRDGFWVVGNWSGNLTLISRTGAVVQTATAPTSASDVAYWKDADNVEHVLYLKNATGDGEVYEYNITTNTMGTTPLFNCATTSAWSGSSGGCFVAEYDEKVCFFADSQQSPQLICIYELEAAEPGPVPPTPVPTGEGMSEILWSNEIEKDMVATMTFNVALNNGQSPEGATVTVFNEDLTYNATVDANGYAELNVRKGVNDTIRVAMSGYATFEAVEFVEEDEYSYDVTLDEIIAPVDGLYVSPTGLAVWDGVAGGGVTPGPGPQPGNNSFTEDFEGGLNGWNVLTVNSDGGEWIYSDDNLGGYDYTELAHTGTGFAMCYSYVDYVGAFNTDSYMYTPQKYAIENGSTLTFWADNANDSYPENFSVCVATADNPTAADFTQVWSGGAKGTGNGGAAVRHQNNRYENWRSHSIDLSAYAGQEVYIAFHDVNYDAYEIWIDDVELTAGTKGNRAPLSYKVMLDNHYVGETTANMYMHDVEGFEEGSVHTTSVAPLYLNGMGEWMTYTWTYKPCDNFTGATEFAAEELEGGQVKLTWTMPNGPTPPTPPTPGQGQWYQYGTDVVATGVGAGGAFYWGVMFPAGSYTGEFVTKAATYEMSGYPFSGTVTIYNDGTNAPATAVGTMPVSVAGSADQWAEFEFAEPIAIDDTKNLWIIFYNETSTTYPAAACVDAGDPNARWVSLDGTSWMDLATAGLSGYSWIIKAYVAQGAKGEVSEISVPTEECNNAGYLTSVPVTANRAMWDYVASFTGTSAGQQAVATDGEYIYTASWQSAPTGGHTFYQYTMDGTFVEGFEIAGATGIRDLTTDGEYFYGTSGGSQIFILDFATRTLVGTINCSGLTSRHISYDPERDGFWSGNWSTLALYSRTGALLQNGPAPTSAYGSAYYKDSDNVEHLFLFCQPNSDCKVYDYNITTGTLGTSVVLDYSNVAPGCTGIAGGCFIGEYDGNTCWFGNSQQDPNLIAIFELEAGTPGPGPGPQPGEDGIMGALIYRNGEFLAFLEGATVSEYVDESEFEVGETYEYELRVVYEGGIDTAHYATSCPVDATITFEGLNVAENDEVISAIYPNPTSGDLHINAVAMKHITVFNTMGQVVYNQDVNADEMVLNMSQLESGIYMIKVETETGNSVKRITVVK